MPHFRGRDIKSRQRYDFPEQTLNVMLWINTISIRFVEFKIGERRINLDVRNFHTFVEVSFNDLDLQPIFHRKTFQWWNCV